MGGDVRDEAPLVLTYYSGFFKEMNTVKLSSTENSFTLYAIARNSTLLPLDGKT